MREVNIIISSFYHYYAWYMEYSNTIHLSRRVNEDNIFYILEHEYIHAVLNNFLNYTTCHMFDNIAEKLYYFIHREDDDV